MQEQTVSQVSPDLFFGTSGPEDAPLVFCAEAWGADEAASKKPLVGSSGQVFDGILREAGIDRRKVLVTNVVAARPPDNEFHKWFGNPRSGFEEVRGIYPSPFVLSELRRLQSQLTSHPRTLIVACGNYAMWALSSLAGTSNVPGSGGVKAPNGIVNWRGSMVYADCLGDGKTKLLPVIHPAAIMRVWTERAITVHDLKSRVPQALSDDWQPSFPPIVWAPPTFAQACQRFETWLRRAESGSPLRIACDIETTKNLLITCIGFAESTNFAMSIPFVRKVPNGLDSFWTTKEEATLTNYIQRLLSHPNISIEGQNFIYDSQYISHYLGVLPRCDFDTMLAFHLCFPGISKGLDYLSSLFCRYHRYWKEDGKDWDSESGTLEEHLYYNAEDCLRTFEVATTLRTLIETFGLQEQWLWVQRKRDLAYRMMERAVLVDQQRRNEIAWDLMIAHAELSNQLLQIIPQKWVGEPGRRKGNKKDPVYWFESSKQLKQVFGEMLGMKIPAHRKTGEESLGKEALNELVEKYPEWTRLFMILGDFRSVGVFITHFIRAPLENNGRMRCSFNPAGTETFRWSSSKNAFGRGTNLQNLPMGTED